MQALEAGKDTFARFRGRLTRSSTCPLAPDTPLRDRVRATTCILTVAATCMFYLQQVDDPHKLWAIVLKSPRT